MDASLIDRVIIFVFDTISYLKQIVAQLEEVSSDFCLKPKCDGIPYTFLLSGFHSNTCYCSWMCDVFRSIEAGQESQAREKT